MPLELKEIKDYHDKAFTYSQTTRENASNDLVFANITQWDDDVKIEDILNKEEG